MRFFGGAEPSRGDGGAFLLLDLRGDQGGAQALVAAPRQRRGDFSHQRPDLVAGFRHHQGKTKQKVLVLVGTPVAVFSDEKTVSFTPSSLKHLRTCWFLLRVELNIIQID